MRAIAIVQARFGSMRFPGKMLQFLGHFPILHWVLHRVNRAKGIHKVILATSDHPRDLPLKKVADEIGVETFFGDEQDVLHRFSEAAKGHDANAVIRICGDNPFICPIEIERLVRFHRDNDYSYSFNHQDRLGSGYADGFGAEIMDYALLEELNRNVRHRDEREHLTLNIWRQADAATKIGILAAPRELAFPDLRFDIDEPADLVNLLKLCDAGINLESTATEIVQLHHELLKE